MKWFLLVILTILLSFSCKDDNDRKEKAFRILNPLETGISFSNSLRENDSLNYFTYGYLYMGGGVSAGDINNDGLIDLFFSGNQVPNKLYLNKGNLEFEDITEKAGISGDTRWYTGVTMADVNNDGFLDIYCSVGGKFKPNDNQLFINNGNNTFREEAKKYGVADSGNSVQATFFDYDLDGDLDLYIANYPPTSFNAPNSYYAFKKNNPKEVETDKLFRNDNNTFTDVTKEAGLLSFGLTLSATVGDVNQDGWPDLYVSNDFSTPDLFYINNKNGTFSEKVKSTTKNTSFYGMGVDIADFNNDGLLDILQVDMMAKNNRRAKANMASMNPALFWSTVNSGFHYQFMQNSLQINNGVLNDSLPNFSNVSRLAGISSTDWSWGPLFADLNNDGWKDIFVSNGTRREINNRDYFNGVEKGAKVQENSLMKSLAIPSEPIDNFVFQNNGDLTFKQTNEEWGLVFKGFSNGGVYADLDNDGDLEIVTNNIDDVASIFENTNKEKNNHLTLKFKGPEKNPFGVGVKVSLNNKNFKQFQELTMTRGFQSSVAPQLHFGLAQIDNIDSLIVTWPDKKQQQLTNLKSNQLITLDYKNAMYPQETQKIDDITLFETIKDSTRTVNYKHIENFHDDFAKEVLLPHKTSMFGPGIAIGDLNGDQLDDIYIGGASKSPGGIYFQENEKFIKQENEITQKDKAFEDMDALIFDADNDGDNDLYVVSGGNEFSPDSKMLQDRLYINNGKGEFTKPASVLPEMITSGSRVHPFDFDKDGDLDLFVGGRLIPENYPLPADSYILENVSTSDNPKFINITDKVAPSLENLGMVTDASWTDIDNDGWTDLLIVGEWMPITILKNNNGIFKDVTEDFGLKETNGWWFSIQDGDFDGDGDIDFIAGNLGLNYKYKANKDETFDIYFNDFDKNKKNDIVLSYFNDGEKFPVRGRECSSQQIPAIKSKFKNYDSFSTATLEDIYTGGDLDKSLHYQVKTFASVYIENQGDTFKIHQLPNEAQVSSINKILVEDFNKDGHLDAVIAGNLYASEVETPRADASIGLFLKGNGDGSFSIISPRESGFVMSGDTKDMSILKTNSSTFIVGAKNNDYLQTIRIN